MVNQQLSDYVREQLEQGKNKEEIKKELLGARWKETDINQVLGISVFGQTPRPPSTPSFASTGQQQLDPKAVGLFFFRWVFAFIVIAFWAGFSLVIKMFDTVTIAGFLGIGLLFLLGALIFAFIVAKLQYHFYRYELTEEGFRKELGVIFKKYVTIPYDRIQNVNISRGILDRILGLSGLSIQTAGTGLAEGKLPGLSREAAEQLRNELIHRARQTRSQGL